MLLVVVLDRHHDDEHPLPSLPLLSGLDSQEVADDAGGHSWSPQGPSQLSQLSWVEIELLYEGPHAGRQTGDGPDITKSSMRFFLCPPPTTAGLPVEVSPTHFDLLDGRHKLLVQVGNVADLAGGDLWLEQTWHTRSLGRYLEHDRTIVVNLDVEPVQFEELFTIENSAKIETKVLKVIIFPWILEPFSCTLMKYAWQ